jgi:hypothetical protein
MIEEDRYVDRNKIKNFTSLSESEKSLIFYIRKLNYGTLELLVQGGKPVLIRQPIKTVRLIDTR